HWIWQTRELGAPDDRSRRRARRTAAEVAGALGGHVEISGRGCDLHLRIAALRLFVAHARPREHSGFRRARLEDSHSFHSYHHFAWRVRSVVRDGLARMAGLALPPDGESARRHA